MTGSPIRSASAPRMSKPPQPASPKFVAPLEESAPARAGGARGATAGPAPRRGRHAGEPEHLLHRVDQGPDGLVRTLPDVAGHLRHLVNEEPALGVENRRVVRRPAVVQA